MLNVIFVDDLDNPYIPEQVNKEFAKYLGSEFRKKAKRNNEEDDKKDFFDFVKELPYERF